MQDMEQIYRSYAQTVYRFLLAKTGDADAAEELTQETFYQAVKSAGRYNGSCSVATWLCAIARNKMHEYYRKKNRELPLDDIINTSESMSLSAVQTVTSAEKELLSSEKRVELMKALQVLEPSVREVIYMRVFGEMSFREIGTVLGHSENWARVTYYRGREYMKRCVRKGECGNE